MKRKIALSIYLTVTTIIFFFSACTPFARFEGSVSTDNSASSDGDASVPPASEQPQTPSNQPPPPPIVPAPSQPSFTSCPNKPTGAVTVLDTSFTTTDGEGQLWELYPGAGKITEPARAPASAPYANASILPVGSSVGGQQTIWPKPGKQQPLTNLYMCMTWKMNADFVGLRTANKLVFLAAQDFTYGKSGMNGLLMLNPRDGYPPKSFRMIFAHNSGQLDNSHACSADLGLICNPNVTDTPIYPDTWYTVEAYIVASTCQTCKDAKVKWWINGTLQGNYTNLNYGDGIINEWQINHTWDGSRDKQCGPPTDPSNAIGRDCTKDQIHYFDHVILASVNGK